MKNQKVTSIWASIANKDLKELSKLCYEDSNDYSVAVKALRGASKRGNKQDTARVIDEIINMDRPLFNPRSWRA